MHFCFLLPIIWQVFHFTTQILLFDIHQTLFLETFKTPPLDFKYKFWICLHLDKRNVQWFMLYSKLQLSSWEGKSIICGLFPGRGGLGWVYYKVHVQYYLSTSEWRNFDHTKLICWWQVGSLPENWL